MEPDELMQHYLEIGVLSIEGVDENGEMLISVTDKAEVLAPELFKFRQEEAEKIMLDMFEKGLVDITYDENLTAYISISDYGKKVIEDLNI